MQSTTRGHFDSIQPQLLSELFDLVRLESPSHDKDALDALAAVLARRLRALGASVDVVANPAGGDHVVARFAGRDERKPALVLGHFDTVWPRGTLARMPVFVDAAGRAFGPGIYDMKASLVIVLAVIESLTQAREELTRPVWVVFTSDEEIGSPSSRTLIEDLAALSAYALVVEPAMADGGLKTARKGVGRFRLEVEGKAAHAGVAPENGQSAIVELAHQILRLERLQNRALGTTINVGVIAGGTTTNVVPAHAAAEIDVRVASAAEADRIQAAFHSLDIIGAAGRITVSGGFNRPPMERTPAIASLFAQAQRIGRTIGIELTEGATGGGSDGNFTAAKGVPTLDGLGPRGGGAHADDEHIVIDSLAERASLLHALLLELRVEP